MANDFYEVTYSFTPFSKVRGSEVKFEFDAVEAAFDKLPTLGDLLSGNPFFLEATGTGDAMAVSNVVAWTTYTDKGGYRLSVKAPAGNTTNVTINVDGLGAKSVRRNDGDELVAGDIVGDGIYDMIYDADDGVFKIQAAWQGLIDSAETYASNANDSAVAAAASASTASGHATTATNAKTAAETAQGLAEDAQTAAEAAQAAAETAYDSFDDRYLGAKSSDPATDNDGDALVTGALYYNATDGDMYVWSGSAWVATYTDIGGLGWADITDKPTFDGVATDGIAATVNAATGKTTPVDGDSLGIVDSEASNVLKKLTFANLKAWFKSYYDSVATTLTNKTLTGYTETVHALSGTTVALDPSNGTIQTHTLSGTTTYTDSLSSGQSITLVISNSGGYGVTWPACVWPNGAEVDPESSGTNIYEIQKVGSILYIGLAGVYS